MEETDRLQEQAEHLDEKRSCEVTKREMNASNFTSNVN